MLVATDIAARGIDVEALGHVVNFDVPKVAEDYIHRVGRTARAQMTGEAFTLVSPEEKQDFSRIERAVGAPIERAHLDGFAYENTAEAPLEVPKGERVRAIRKQRAQERARAAARNGGAELGTGAAGGSEKPSRPRRRRYGKRR